MLRIQYASEKFLVFLWKHSYDIDILFPSCMCLRFSGTIENPLLSIEMSFKLNLPPESPVISSEV